MILQEFVVDRLPAAEALFNAVPIRDSVLTCLPAEVHFVPTIQGREIEEARLQVFYQATCLMDSVYKTLQLIKCLFSRGFHGRNARCIHSHSTRQHHLASNNLEFFFSVAHIRAKRQSPVELWRQPCHRSFGLFMREVPRHLP